MYANWRPITKHLNVLTIGVCFVVCLTKQNEQYYTYKIFRRFGENMYIYFLK